MFFVAVTTVEKYVKFEEGGVYRETEFDKTFQSLKKV